MKNLNNVDHALTKLSCWLTQKGQNYLISCYDSPNTTLFKQYYKKRFSRKKLRGVNNKLRQILRAVIYISIEKLRLDATNKIIVNAKKAIEFSYAKATTFQDIYTLLQSNICGVVDFVANNYQFSRNY